MAGVALPAAAAAAPAAGDGAGLHAELLPNASPATTQGVVSELIWITLPGGCVTEILALEGAPAPPLDAGAGLAPPGVAAGLLPPAGAGLGLLGVELGAPGEAAAGVEPPVEPPAAGVAAPAVAEGAGPGLGLGAAAPPKPLNAVATSFEDR